jgi:hypothetical protein
VLSGASLCQTSDREDEIMMKIIRKNEIRREPNLMINPPKFNKLFI